MQIWINNATVLKNECYTAFFFYTALFPQPVILTMLLIVQQKKPEISQNVHIWTFLYCRECHRFKNNVHVTVCNAHLCAKSFSFFLSSDKRAVPLMKGGKQQPHSPYTTAISRETSGENLKEVSLT